MHRALSEVLTPRRALGLQDPLQAGTVVCVVSELRDQLVGQKARAWNALVDDLRRERSLYQQAPARCESFPR